MNIAVFFSGAGSNMAALARALPEHIKLAVTDNPNAQGIQRAESLGVPVKVLGQDTEQHIEQHIESEARALLTAHNIDLILLAGFMRLLSADFVAAFRWRILNIHPSLLPAFKGKNAIARAFAAKVGHTGVTVHAIDATMDGGITLAQTRVAIRADDTLASLTTRMHAAEHALYPDTVVRYMAWLAKPDALDGHDAEPAARPARKAAPKRLEQVATQTISTEPLVLKDACGLYGVHIFKAAESPTSAPAFEATRLGLHMLQHRGQEGAGIASFCADTGRIGAHRKKGWVRDVFFNKPARAFDVAEGGNLALDATQMMGHVRYSTAGSKKEKNNLQPFVMNTRFGALALAHNGNLVKVGETRRALLAKGQVFASDSDSEIFLHLIAASRATTLTDAVKEAALQVEGAFSLLILSSAGLIALRDPLGLRPLCVGQGSKGIAVASESSALEATDMAWQFDLDAGEMVVLDRDGALHREYYAEQRDKGEQRFCAFEYVYFMRSNAAFAGVHTAKAREAMGEILWDEAEAAADCVVPVLESGLYGAMGFARAANLPFAFGLLKSNYVARTFITPGNEPLSRRDKVRLKLSVDCHVVAGKRVVLVDDSVVRANTLPIIIDLLREAGAASVHVRIFSPLITDPCFYGIDMPSRHEFASNTYHDVAGICQHVGADSLAFLSTEGLQKAISAQSDIGTCRACFDGNYPTPT